LASPHCSVKNGARGNGAKHALYVGGEGRHSDREDVVYKEDGNLPKWAGSAVEFFAAADEHERKSWKPKTGIRVDRSINGRSYKELELAIPREAKDPVKWAQQYVRELLGDQHPYRMGVHDKKAADGGRNPHLHLMFSTRTMDGHDRPAERFFKRANTGTFTVTVKGKKETRPHEPGAGGAKKSELWNSREAVPHARGLFERHVKMVAPEFKLGRSTAPEPKIGPELKRAGQKYEEDREVRVVSVYEIRAAKRELAALDKEIEREELMVGTQARRPSAMDEFWAKMDSKKEPQRETVPVKHDWSKFADVAGSRGKADDERKGKQMEPNTGPGYFPETKQEKERNRDEAGALHRIDQREQEQPTKSRSDDLWDRMERDRQQKAAQEKDREKDSGRDFDM
jgi:hypothetical protein